MFGRLGPRSVFVVVVLAGWCAACAALLGIEDTIDEPPFDAGRLTRDAVGDVRVVADGGDPDDGAPADGSAEACPGIHGPKMVRLEAGFCIDATEVTRGDYAAFMAASPSVAAQAPECAFNTDFEPAGWPYPADAALTIPAGVNWCDAVAFCAWAGKRLCGSRADGGVIPVEAGSDPKLSEWASACSHDGTRVFAYGNSYQSTACNGKPRDAGRTLPVGTLPLCEGGDPGIFDMSGNAWEWDLSCVADDAGRPRYCGQRGGSYTDDSNLLVCALTNYQMISLTAESAGFRCCAR